jgi:hypothetical protein
MKKTESLLTEYFNKTKLFDYPPSDDWEGKSVRIPTIGDLITDSLYDWHRKKWDKLTKDEEIWVRKNFNNAYVKRVPMNEDDLIKKSMSNANEYSEKITTGNNSYDKYKTLDLGEPTNVTHMAAIIPLGVDPKKCKHTKQPVEYSAWIAWAEKKSKTHDQRECPNCGSWAVWIKKDYEKTR